MQSDIMNSASNSGWMDISVTLRDGMMHWPGDPPVKITRVLDIGHGDSHNLSQLTMGSHSGTHLDAPLHFIQQALSVDRMPLDAVIGPARVLLIEDKESVKPQELGHYHIRRGERILFKTMNSSNVWRLPEFTKDFIFINKEAAEMLAELKPALVGIDYLSVGGYRRGGSEVHRALLGSGIWILEGLDLSLIEPGDYDLICLPLRIENGDGAPARAVLRKVMR